MLELDWNLMLANSTSMGIAYLLALSIAWNREANARGAGLRTFPLYKLWID